MGDHRLSPAYDLLNTRIHVNDEDFALDEGLLPKHMAQTSIDQVEKLVNSSFLDEKTKQNYLQAYQNRLKKLQKLGL
jgi:serine/threonine-protein kinase HipA